MTYSLKEVLLYENSVLLSCSFYIYLEGFILFKMEV